MFLRLPLPHQHVERLPHLEERRKEVASGVCVQTKEVVIAWDIGVCVKGQENDLHPGISWLTQCQIEGSNPA